MQISDFLPAAVPTVPITSTIVDWRLPPRAPGREHFPCWEGVDLVLPAGAAIYAAAAGQVLAHDPLHILHENGVITTYVWPGAPVVAVGQAVAAGAELGCLGAAEGRLHFSCGLSLYVPRFDPDHLVPFDPRPLLANLGLPRPDPAEPFWRGPLPLSAVPLLLRRTMVAIEDRRFYQHWGLDPLRMLGALRANLRRGRIVEGASTITQQSARSALRLTRRGWLRKLLEMPVALVLERYHDKATILELYFNTIYWGRGATTVAAAAADFFGKNPWQLNFRECLILASLPNHPLKWEIAAADIERLERKAAICLEVLKSQAIIDTRMADLILAQPYELLAPASGAA